MIRFLENILLIAGAVTLGGVLNCIAVGCLAYLVLGPPKVGEFGSGIGTYYAAVFCGAPLGALIGLFAGIGCIARRGSRPWGLAVWGGIALGLLTGAALSWAASVELVSGILRVFDEWLGAAIGTALLATIGGIIGAVIAWQLNLRKRKRSVPRRRSDH